MGNNSLNLSSILAIVSYLCGIVALVLSIMGKKDKKTDLCGNACKLSILSLVVYVLSMIVGIISETIREFAPVIVSCLPLVLILLYTNSACKKAVPTAEAVPAKNAQAESSASASASKAVQADIGIVPSGNADISPMREVFTNSIGQQVIITHEGIHHSYKGNSTIIPRDEITKPLQFSLGNLAISTSLKMPYTFTPEGEEDKKRLKAVFGKFNPLIGKPIDKQLTDEDFGYVPPKPIEIIPDSKEFRMHCRVCGHVYCYTMGEYKANEQLKKEVNQKELFGAANSLFTSSLVGSSQYQEAEMMKMRIKDFSRCPKCNSADIHELAEGEMPPAAQAASPSAASPMEELKKLKELGLPFAGGHRAQGRFEK